MCSFYGTRNGRSRERSQRGCEQKHKGIECLDKKLGLNEFWFACTHLGIYDLCCLRYKKATKTWWTSKKKKAKVVASQNDNCPVVKLLFTLHRFGETSKIASSVNVIKNVRFLSVLLTNSSIKHLHFSKLDFGKKRILISVIA